MTNAEKISWWNTFHKFQLSRERTWGPKINTALNNQIKAVISHINQYGVNSAISNLTAIIPMDEISVIIKNIYIDAGTVFGGKAYQMVKKQAVKALMPMGYNEELVNEIIAYFQLRLLNEAVLPITETTRDYVLRILIRSQQEGVSINNIVSELKNTDLTRARARMIARTETVKASNYGAVQSVKKLGYDTLKIWISGVDLRTRRIPRDEADHLHANGMKVPMNEPFRIRDKSSGFVSMMQPGDPNGGAENVVNCRCTVGFEIL